MEIQQYKQILNKQFKDADYTIIDSFIQKIYNEINESLNNSTTEFSTNNTVKLFENIYNEFNKCFQLWLKNQIMSKLFTYIPPTIQEYFNTYFKIYKNYMFAYEFVCYNYILQHINFDILEKLYFTIRNINDTLFIDNNYHIEDIYLIFDTIKNIYLIRKREIEINNFIKRLNQLEEENSRIIAKKIENNRRESPDSLLSSK